MYTKRQSLLVLIAALILTILLEEFSAELFKYNVITAILSGILYFAVMVFIVVDGYHSVKSENNYYKFSFLRDIIIIAALLIIFYCCGNFNITTVIVSAIILLVMLLAIKKLTKLADFYNES